MYVHVHVYDGDTLTGGIDGREGGSPAFLEGTGREEVLYSTGKVALLVQFLTTE